MEGDISLLQISLLQVSSTTPLRNFGVRLVNDLQPLLTRLTAVSTNAVTCHSSQRLDNDAASSVDLRFFFLFRANGVDFNILRAGEFPTLALMFARCVQFYSNFRLFGVNNIYVAASEKVGNTIKSSNFKMLSACHMCKQIPNVLCVRHLFVEACDSPDT